MVKIQRMSLFFRFVFIFLFISLPFVFFYNHITQDINSITFSTTKGYLTLPTNSYLRSVNTLLEVFPALIQMFIIYCLIKLFHLYEVGKVFSISNIKYIRYIGLALIAKVIFDPFIQAVMSYLVLKENPSSSYQLSVSFTPYQLQLFLTGLITVLIAKIMKEACYLKADNDYIV